MNLIGYGLAKYDKDFVNEFKFPSKSAFAKFVVDIGMARTVKAVLNRMDSFDPYFDNGRRGWHQRTQRMHIKLFIDSFFGHETAKGFANIVKMYMREIDDSIPIQVDAVSPVTQSRFKQLQETGKEAELYFMNNYNNIDLFSEGVLEDARLLGDGYDFQIYCHNRFYLVEIKGLKERRGSIRMTQNEFEKANDYKSDYVLVVVSNLLNNPHIRYFQNPLSSVHLHPVSQDYSIVT